MATWTKRFTWKHPKASVQATMKLSNWNSLVQSARQFWKKLRDVLKTLGFGGGDIDPCLLYKKTDKGIVLIGLYVDDLLIIGDSNEIDEVIAGLKNHFSVKVEDEINDYLSCEIQFSEDGTKAWIGQPHLIAKMEKTFSKEIKFEGIRNTRNSQFPDRET